jgi:glycosyltransferase involved in cell wall biosynthesis
MRKKVIVRGPALSRSGYGEQTRYALRSLREFEERFDIYLLNVGWGQTSWLALDDEERHWFDFLIHKTISANQQPNPQYDISIQVTIPNEWERIAAYNIGFTAGIECSRIAPVWVEKSNMMDKIIVVSNHAKFGFENTSYVAKNKQTGVEIPDYRCTTPVTVANFPVRELTPQVPELELETESNFLFVAQNGPRKNLENTIKWFVEEFKDDENVGLVLKTFCADTSIVDHERTTSLVTRIIKNTKISQKDLKCHVYLLHGEMSEEELHGLYNHPKMTALVNLAHGEGFGLPLFESAIAGLPVITVDWGGPLDFLYAPVKKKGKNKFKSRPHFIRVDYEISPVQEEALWEGVIIPQAMWTFAKERSYKKALRDTLKNHGVYLKNAKKLKKYVVEKLSFKNQSKIFADAVWDGATVTTVPEISFDQVQTFE